MAHDAISLQGWITIYAIIICAGIGFISLVIDSRKGAGVVSHRSDGFAFFKQLGDAIGGSRAIRAAHAGEQFKKDALACHVGLFLSEGRGKRKHSGHKKE